MEDRLFFFGDTLAEMNGTPPLCLAMPPVGYRLMCRLSSQRRSCSLDSSCLENVAWMFFNFASKKRFERTFPIAKKQFQCMIRIVKKCDQRTFLTSLRAANLASIVFAALF